MTPATKELLANLDSIKQLMDANAKTSAEANEKNQLKIDKIAENQSIFQGNLREILTSLVNNNGMLATIETTVSSITRTTTDLLKTAVTGVKTLVIKEIGNIADTITHLEGDMAVLWNLFTSVQPTQVDRNVVPTGPTKCSDDNGNPHGPSPGPSLSLQD
jgi:hypothetical protein